MRHEHHRESTADRDRADAEAGATPISEIRDHDEYRVGDYYAVGGGKVECAECCHDLGRVKENTKESLARRAVE